MARYFGFAQIMLVFVFCNLGIGESLNAWRAEDVVGLSITSEDQDSKASYHFNSEGWVTVSVTSKKQGWSTGPILPWKIVEGVLHIGEGEQFTLISRSQEQIVVQNGKGVVREFRIEK